MGASIEIAKPLKKLSQTPLTAQREKRLWVLHQPPKCSGKSRQGARELPDHYIDETIASSLFRPTLPTQSATKCSIRRIGSLAAHDVPPKPPVEKLP